MVNLYKRLILFFLLISPFYSQSQTCSDPSCTAITINVDLSANPDTIWTTSNISRSGECCGLTGVTCIKFQVTVNSQATEASFNVSNPAPPQGAAFYKIDCGPDITLGSQTCLGASTTFCIVYCKSGNDKPDYTISTSKGYSKGADVTVRQNCTGVLSTSGLNASSVTWTAIAPAPISYLSCTSGCATTNVTPTSTTPSTLKYVFCGTRTGCASRTICDTITVNVVPGMTVAMSPASPVICSGGSGTVTLTATPTGGNSPYTYSWSTGEATQSITVNSAGTYTVNVSDATSCPPITQTITVNSITTPSAPSISSNSPVCASQTLNLYAPTIAGATYTWTGPNGFSSALEDPTIAGVTAAAAGTYSLSVTVGGCTSPVSTTTVVVNPIPSAPTISSNTPICENQTLNLFANTIAGATYTWTGPNGFSSALEDPSIAGVTVAASGTYSLSVTVNGCASSTSTTAVTINPIPAAPTVSSNSPICANQTLNLFANTIAGATYTWTGPNGFSSALEDPTIASATTAATGTYSLSVTVNGCTSTISTTSVTVNPIPAAPTVSSNTPVCANQTLNLFANTIAGATYTWTGPNGFSSALEDPTIASATVAASGTYSLSATVNGCTSTISTTSVTVNPIPAAPTVSSNSPICANQTLNLFANTIAGATYTWTGPNGFSSALEDPTIASATVAASGTYSLSVTINGCTSTVATTSVTVNAIPANPVISSNTPICENQTLNLFANTIAGATYTWTGPNGFTSALEDPSIASATTAASGTYSLSVTVNGCTSNIVTTSVIVNPTPAAPVISSNSPICANQTLNLFANTIAGATYTWSGPNGFTSALEDPTIASATIAASGTYTLSVTVNGCTSAISTTSVTVNPIPANPVISSNTPICAGQQLNLFANTIAGATYTWTGPNGFSSALEDPSIAVATVAASGTYSLSVTVNGCTSNVRTTAVIVNPIPTAPTISSNTPVCENQTLNLFANTIAGATYTWTGPNGFSSALEDPTIASVTAAASGTYSLSVTVNGCTSSISTTTVTVNPIPAAPTVSSNTPVCEGQTLNLSANTIAGATYTWTGPNGFTSALEDPSIAGVTLAASGTYSLNVSVNGCASANTTTTVTINPIPTAPTASSNSPICVGQQLNLFSNTIAGATYSWTGPNGFTSALEDPSIAGATAAATGTYSVTVTVNGCTSVAGTTTATVNSAPSTPTLSSNSPVCAGQQLDLFASLVAGATYSWTGPNGFTSALQNPSIAGVTTAASGTYTVTVNNGCASTPVTIDVVVNPKPNSPTISSNTPICEGQTLNLSATTIAGATYTWTGPNGFTSALEDPSIAGATVAASGTYSVTVTVNGCTSNVRTTAVVVNPIPTAPTISSNTPVCANQTLNLFANTIAGATYTWTGPNGFSSALEDPTIASVTAAASGTYTLSVTVNGCTSSTSTTSVTVNPIPAAPTVSSNTPVCEGQDINLSANTIAGATYTWTGPNGFTSALEDPTITGVTLAASGTYSLSVSVNGCGSAVSTTSVTVNPTPAAPTASSNSPICINQTINLSTPAVAGATYSWTGPNGFTSASQNPSITNATAAEAGVYSLTITVNGCTSAAGTTTVVVNNPPATPTLSSNSPVCAGQQLDLFASLIAGATYSWTGPNGFTSALQNPSIAAVTIAATGTYTVTVNNGCTSAAVTINVTINPKPATPTVTSNSPVCNGQDLNLFANTIAGATYTWTGPNGFSSALEDPTITGATLAASGTYSLSVTVNGCTSNIRTIAVVVNPIPAAPTVSSNTPVCEGQTLILSANTIAGATYTWTGPNGFSSALEDPTISGVTAAATGTYSLSVSVNGCTSSISTTNVTVNPIPAAPTISSNAPICEGQQLDLSANTIAGATYTWTGPNGFTSALEDPSIGSVTIAASGTYSLNVTVNGCASTNATTNVVINPTPATPVASSNSPLCEGQTLDLTTTLVAGATYTWTGPNSFSSSLQNPSIAGATAINTGDYILTVTVNGCTSVADTVSVFVNTTPTAPVATSNSPVCAGDTLNLFSTTLAGAVYSWTGPNGFTSASQNPSISNVTIAATGTYTVVADNGCAALPATVTVTVNPTPTAPNASSNSPVCAGSDLNLFATNVAGATYSWTGPNGFSSALQNSTITGATVAAAGTYSVTVTVNGCTSTAKTTVVTIGTPTVANAGTDITTCANNISVVLSGTVTGGSTTGIWSTSGTGSFSPTASTLNATYIPSNADTAAGTITLTLTSTNNKGCTASVSSITLTITDAPTADAGTDISVCGNNSTVTLNGSVTNATGGVWSTSGSGSFSPDNLTLNATYTPSPADTTAGIVTLVLTTTGFGNCNAVSDTMQIIIGDSPTVDAGADQIVCLGSPNSNLNGSISGGVTTGSWSTLGSGSFSPNNTTLNATYIPSNADTAAGSVLLILTSDLSSGCSATSDTLLITYKDLPVVFAGNDTSVCGNASSVPLSGSVTGGASSGIWTTTGTGTFSPNDKTLNAIYTPSAADTTAGTVTLTLTTTNGCVADSDQVVITITDAPTVFAGADQIVCSNNSTVTLTGTVSGATTTGIWTTSGSGSFVPDDVSLNTTYIPSTADTAAGTVIIILTSTNNGGCTSSADTLVISIIDPPTVFAGLDTSICSNSTFKLNGQIFGGFGSGVWTTSGSGSFAPNNTTLGAVYIPSNADTTAGFVTLTLTSTNNGNCIAAFDDINILITDGPSINAGSDISYCSNNPTVNISGTVNNSTGGQWSTLGSGSFGDQFALTTTYTPSAADITADTVVLVLTTTGNGTCNPSTDTLLVIATASPVVNAGNNIFICTGDGTAQLNGTVTGGGGTGIWTTTGSGTFTPNDTTLNAVYNLSSADTTAGSVMLILTSTNNGNCNPSVDTVIINITPVPSTFAGNDTTVCGNTSGVLLNGVVIGGAGTGIWTTTGSGTFTPSDTILTATYIPSTADTTAGTVTLILTPTKTCLAIADSITITFNDAPLVDAGTDLSVCYGGVFNLSGTINGVAGSAIWTTNGGGSFSPDDVTLNATYIPVASDTLLPNLYAVLTSTGSTFCSNVSDTVYLDLGTKPNADFTTTKACENQNVILTDASTTSNGTINSWSWTIGTSTFNTSSVSYNFGATGTYSVQLIVSSDIGCSDTITKTVTVNPQPQALFTFVSDCHVDSVSFIDASTIGGGAITTWSWDFGDTTTSTTQNPYHDYVFNGSHIVTLTVTSDSGCSSTYVDTVDVVPSTQAKFFANIDCSNGVQFTDSSIANNITSWSWNFGDTGTDSQQNPFHIYADTGTYNVQLIIQTADNCPDTVTMPITIYPAATADYIPHGGTYLADYIITFTDQSTNAFSWFWNFGNNFDTSIVQNPTFSYTQPGNYIVLLTVTNQAGCPDTVSYLFTITDVDVLPMGIPTAFTPNGDGINDILYVRGGPFGEFELRIFNEWGNQIFTSTSQADGWDGTISGNKQPAGKYVYTFIGKDIAGKEYKITGEITLIR